MSMRDVPKDRDDAVWALQRRLFRGFVILMIGAGLGAIGYVAIEVVARHC
jgi:hypothetical protein